MVDSLITGPPPSPPAPSSSRCRSPRPRNSPDRALRKTAVVNLRAAIQDMVPTDFGPHRVEREEAFCLDAINAIGDYTEARRRWAEDHPVDAGQHFRRMGADGRLLPDEWRPPAHQKSARELYEREIAKITGDDPWTAPGGVHVDSWKMTSTGTNIARRLWDQREELRGESRGYVAAPQASRPQRGAHQHHAVGGPPRNVDCESLLGVGRDSLLVSMRAPTTPRASMTHADADSTAAMCGCLHLPGRLRGYPATRPLPQTAHTRPERGVGKPSGLPRSRRRPHHLDLPHMRPDRVRAAAQHPLHDSGRARDRASFQPALPATRL